MNSTTPVPGASPVAEARYGVGSMVAPLRRVLQKHAREAFVDAQRIAAQWRELGFLAAPAWEAGLAESEALVEQLAAQGVETLLLPRDDTTTLDSLYTHDPVLVLEPGAVLCRPGKPARRGEPAAAAGTLRRAGIPILGAIEGEGTLEGGDVLILGPRTLAVGQGYRTNAEGIRQLRALLEGLVDELIVVPLPHWRGPADVLHLQSLVSLVADDLALVHSPLLAVPFRSWLLERGYQLLEAPPEEIETLGCNVLALAPRRVLVVEGNPRTRRLLERAGCEVIAFAGREIAIKGCGGPTCLTRPLLRE